MREVPGGLRVCRVGRVLRVCRAGRHAIFLFSKSVENKKSGACAL